MTKQYIELETELKELLNSTYNKDLSKRFKIVLDEFSQLGFKLSVTYLSNLINSTDKKFISQRVNYIIKISNLRTEKSIKTIREWKFKKSKSDVTIYYERDNKILDTHRQISIGKSYIGNSFKVIRRITEEPERIINPVWIESDGNTLKPLMFQDGKYYNSLGQRVRG